MAQRKHQLPARVLAGFTIIEMLIVVTIIAALIAILIPVIGAMRDRARAAATFQRMSTIATALDQYKTDMGIYPPSAAPGYTGGKVNSGSAMLAQALLGYLDDDGAAGLGFRLNPGGKGRVYGPYTDQNAGIQSQAGTYGSVRVESAERVVYVDAYGGEILYYSSTGIRQPTAVFGDGTASLFVTADNSAVKDADGTAIPSPESPSVFKNVAVGTPRFFKSMGADSNTSNVATTFGRASYVLISAHKDKVYFSDDDVTFPTR